MEETEMEETERERLDPRESGMARFWGRTPDLILEQADDALPHIDTYRFPPISPDPRAEAPEAPCQDYFVYMTAGMSDAAMPGTAELEEFYQRIEITAYARQPIPMQSDESDTIAWLCGWLAHYPFHKDTYFMHGETFDWGEPIVPGSQMEALYFGRPPFVDNDDLAAATLTAQSFIHIVPISRAELIFKEERGIEAFLALLEQHDVQPLFDLSRRSML